MILLCKIVQMLEVVILCCYHRITDQISKAFNPGLMSDIMTLATENIQLQVRLANIQTFGTAEIAEIHKN